MWKIHCFYSDLFIVHTRPSSRHTKHQKAMKMLLLICLYGVCFEILGDLALRQEKNLYYTY